MDVVLCDEDGAAEGTADRHLAHRDGLRHLAVSAMIYHREHGWVVQRRASDKALFADQWSNSVCTHPLPGESASEAVTRRAREELGVGVEELQPCGTYSYQATDPVSGLREHERVEVFCGVTSDELRPDPAEIAEVAYLPRLSAALRVLDEHGTPWAPLTAAAVERARKPEETPQACDLLVSQYAIFVGQTSAGSMISHGLYGTFDLIDEQTYETLLANRFTAHVPRYGVWTDPGGEPGPSSPGLDTVDPDLLRKLARRGYLVSSRVAERDRFVSVSAGLHEDQKKNLVFVVMPTYDCNLGCEYCFQDHLRKDPQYAEILTAMTPEVATRIVEAMDDIKRRTGWVEGRNALSIGLFGGEPITAATRPALERLVQEICVQRGQPLWAITNGTQLDSCRDLLGPGRIETLQITLDGPPELHDQRRYRRADKGGSFEDIARGIDLALELDCAVDIRMNVDVRNVDEVSDLVKVCADRGWLGRDSFSMEAAPVHRGGPDATNEVMFSHLSLTKQLRTMASGEHRQVADVETVDTKLRDFIQGSMTTGTIPLRSGQFCSAYSGMYVFDAKLDVYACWERTAEPRFRIGRVQMDGTYRPHLKIEAKWRSRAVAVNPVCSGCAFGLWCGGGCASQAEIKTGDMDHHLCEGYSARFKDAAREAFERDAAGIRPRVKLAQKGCG